jgi:selenide,water dikinase
VTGFGLIGHALEIARGAGLTAVLEAGTAPLLAGVEALSRAGVRTGASGRNWASYGQAVTGAEALEGWRRDILCDPQTSGGLLIAAARDATGPILSLARGQGFEHIQVVGSLIDGPPEVAIKPAA